MTYDPERHHRQSMRLKGYDYSLPGYYYVTICTQDRIKRFGDVLDDVMVLDIAGEMVDVEWNRILERYDHVILDDYQIMPNHMHGILQIRSLENGKNKSFGNGTVGTSFMGVLNDDVQTDENDRNDDDTTIKTGHDDGVETIENTFKMVDPACERTPIKDVPTLGFIIGAFKSITTTNYAKNVRQDGWPAFEKRLWQLRFHDHIIRNDDELNRIRQYIADNPLNWAKDENNPENFKCDDRKDS